MDPQHTFLRVHARLSGMLAQLLTPRIRILLEYASLGVAIVLLGILTVMHVNFVAQPGCANEFSGSSINESQLVQIKITSGGLWSQTVTELSETSAGEQARSRESFQIPEVDGEGFSFLAAKFWLSWLGSAARRNKLISKPFKSDTDGLGSQSKGLATGVISNPSEKKRDVAASPQVQQRDFPVPARELSRAAVSHILKKWCRYIFTLYKRIKKITGTSARLWRIAGWHLLMDMPKRLNMLPWRGIDSTLVHWIERRSTVPEPTYLYTIEKGYFWLPENAKSRHNVKTVNVSISAQHSCFGNRWQQLFINGFIGYDTILMNSLLTARGQGYLYNFQTKELYDLSYPQEFIGTPFRFEDYLVSKCGVLLMSLFVFFTTTMSVSFTLRETQSRMLKFTVQLQHHARHRLPTFQLIFVHVIESLVFVPIMIGILFFLFEFYDDQLLAFMVLTLVWLCELFTMISVRTPMSMQYFPRFFLLYFLVFHIYFFSYAYGFSYLAFAATAAFMQHLILYFWNRFEVPALQRFLRQRVYLHQQPGVQITSSTILTSTFHVTRLNARSGNLIGGFGAHQVRNNQPEESNMTGSGAVSRSIWTSLDGARVRSGLRRNFQGGDEFLSLHSADNDHVRRAHAGSADTTDPNYRTTITRGVNTDSIRTSSNAMQYNELRENSTSSRLDQQATGIDLPQTAQAAASMMNQNSLMSFSSLLLWILGGPPDGLVSLPMFRDTGDQRLANSDLSDQENRQNIQSSWWRGSSGLEGLRQRSGHSLET